MASKHPVIDIGRCSLCGGCIEVAPTVFRLNDIADYIEIVDFNTYPQEEVDEAIMICPEDCIEWEE